MLNGRPSPVRYLNPSPTYPFLSATSSSSSSSLTIITPDTQMAAQTTTVVTTEPPRFPAVITFNSPVGFQTSVQLNTTRRRNLIQVCALGDANKKKPGSSVPSSNYVVPMDYSLPGITRPLAEILRDLNKRVPDNLIVKQSDDPQSSFIPWFHANRMLSFYAPGWCGEVRDVIYSDAGSVTVVYRVTVRGSDGEAHREATGTMSAAANGQTIDPVAAAEELAFCKACARFGLGLYLYHED